MGYLLAVVAKERYSLNLTRNSHLSQKMLRIEGNMNFTKYVILQSIWSLLFIGTLSDAYIMSFTNHLRHHAVVHAKLRLYSSNLESFQKTIKPVLTFATGNVNKLKEVQRMIGGDDCKFDLRNVALNLPELQGDPETIAIEKCKAAANLVQGPIFTEDTSLCFNALNGLPGPYVKW